MSFNVAVAVSGMILDFILLVHHFIVATSIKNFTCLIYFLLFIVAALIIITKLDEMQFVSINWLLLIFSLLLLLHLKLLYFFQIFLLLSCFIILHKHKVLNYFNIIIQTIFKYSKRLPALNQTASKYICNSS